MAKENPDTPKKATNSAFRKFEELAKKIVRVPKSKADEKNRGSSASPRSRPPG